MKSSLLNGVGHAATNDISKKQRNHANERGRPARQRARRPPLALRSWLLKTIAASMALERA